MGKLTKNFSRKEAFEWYKYHGVTGKNAKDLQAWQKEDLTPQIEANIKEIAVELQKIRDAVNKQFPQYKGDIGLKTLSWFRPIKWEKLRRRSGASQHIHGHAVDFIVANVPQKEVQPMMNWIWGELNRGAGWNGGLARLHRGSNTSFIHIDLGTKRRWNY